MTFLASALKLQAQLEAAKMGSPVIHHHNERPKIEAFGGPRCIPRGPLVGALKS
jgi:hypothetical protein